MNEMTFDEAIEALKHAVYGEEVRYAIARALVLSMNTQQSVAGKENSSNKKTTLTGNESSNDFYPTTKAVADALNTKVSSLSIATEVNYDDEDLSTYTSTATNSSFNCTNIPIAPNAASEYYIKSATVKTQNPNRNVKFAIWTIAPYYNQQDPMNRKRFTKKYDLAVVVSDDSGLATITFDTPVKIVPDAEVLMASCQTGQKMAYGTYVDSAKTSFIYGNSEIWYDVKPGESPDFAAIYVTSGNCPWYEVKYVLSEDVTTIVESVGDIEQKKYNISPYDSDINKDSDNAVRNSVIYNELNIVKTETIIPEETTYKNVDAITPGGYNGWFFPTMLDETDAVKLKELDIRVTSGVTVKLGIWTFRPYNPNASNAHGYLTLKTDLGTATSADTHAVFTLNDVEYDPVNEILAVSAPSGAIGYVTGVVNGFYPNWYNIDNGYYDTAVGEENSTLMWRPVRTKSTSATVQGLFSITYELAESKQVTTVTNVKNAVGGMLTDVEKLKQGGGTAPDEILRTPYNKYFCLLVDDVTRAALTIAPQLLAKGIRPAYGLKMESIPGEITWDEVKQLQELGFEICFHGMFHGHTPAGTAPAYDSVMIADIAEFKALCDEHGIILHGYLGPNHYPLPVGAFKEFEWARGPYGLETYGVPGKLATTFASIAVWSCDPLSASYMSTIKQNMISAASSVANNQYLAPMCHTQNLVTYIDDYMDVFESWIDAGLEPLRPMDAVKQSLFNVGGIGNNSTFEIQAGTATNPYYLIAGNGTVLHNP